MRFKRLRALRSIALTSLAGCLFTGVCHSQLDWQKAHEAGVKAAKGAQLAEAENYLTRSVAKARGDKNAAPLVRSLVDLGQVFRSEGKFGQAQASYDEALEISTKEFGSESLEVAEVLNGQGELFKVLNDFEKAEPLLLHALEIRQKKASAGNGVIAETQNDLGELYVATGSYDKATPLLQAALESRRKLLGPEHEAIAQTLEASGNLAKRTGKDAEAESLFKQAISMFGKTVGGEHPDYANALESLALLYSAREQYDVAEPLLARVLEIREKVFGSEHHDVGASLDELALLKTQQHRCADAIPLYQRALILWGKIYGEENPWLSADLSNLAGCFETVNSQYGNAELCLTRAVRNDRKGLPPDSLELASDLQHLGVLYYLMNRYPEAAHVLEEALAIRGKMGFSDPETARTGETYVSVLLMLHRESEAHQLQAKIKAAGNRQ
jgi:tetratricopeptide (TPR) repeat protein